MWSDLNARCRNRATNRILGERADWEELEAAIAGQSARATDRAYAKKCNALFYEKVANALMNSYLKLTQDNVEEDPTNIIVMAYNNMNAKINKRGRRATKGSSQDTPSQGRGDENRGRDRETPNRCRFDFFQTPHERQRLAGE